METISGFVIMSLVCLGTCVERCNYSGGSLLCEIRCCGTYWHRFCCDRTGEGEWCTLRGGSGTSSKYCRTGCCGTYYDQHCCPEMTKVPFSSTTQRSNITLVPLYNITDHHSNITSYPSNSTYYGEWCNKTVGRIFCKTGCCGMYWNRTCCPSTTLATVSIVSDLNSIGTNQHRNSTYCCSSSGSPKLTPETSIQTGTLVIIVGCCIAAVIGTIAIIAGISYFLRRRARGAPTFKPTSNSTRPQGPTMYNNPTYFTPATGTVIENQAYDLGL